MTHKLLREWPVKDPPNNADNIRRPDDNRDRCNQCDPRVGSPDSHEDRKFCDKPGEARHTHGHQTADNESNGYHRHDLYKATQLGDFASMRPVIYHPDYTKEE